MNEPQATLESSLITILYRPDVTGGIVVIELENLNIKEAISS